jgi:hypothetical protein
MSIAVVNSIVNFSSESGLPDAPKASGIFFGGRASLIMDRLLPGRFVVLTNSGR